MASEDSGRAAPAAPLHASAALRGPRGPALWTPGSGGQTPVSVSVAEGCSLPLGVNNGQHEDVTMMEEDALYEAEHEPMTFTESPSEDLSRAPILTGSSLGDGEPLSTATDVASTQIGMAIPSASYRSHSIFHPLTHYLLH